MEEWHGFFLAQAGSSGVLIRLMFIGVSINLEKIVSEPGLPRRAAEALILLAAVFTASTLLIVSGQSTLVVGVAVLGVGLVVWGWVRDIQLRKCPIHPPSESSNSRQLAVASSAVWRMVPVLRACQNSIPCLLSTEIDTPATAMCDKV